VNPLGHPVRLRLTGANAADSPHLPALIAGIETDAVLADKGYDADTNRDAIRAREFRTWRLCARKSPRGSRSGMRRW